MKKEFNEKAFTTFSFILKIAFEHRASKNLEEALNTILDEAEKNNLLDDMHAITHCEVLKAKDDGFEGIECKKEYVLKYALEFYAGRSEKGPVCRIL